MLKSSLESKPKSTRSVNIRVIKPNGISAVWNWFTNKNKKANLQNLMYDKKFKLKLNAEELDALKRNGFDLQKLQNIAASNESKMRKNVFILSKDQSELNKSVLLNNSVLCDLMKNKSASKRPRKYKKSLVSSSSLSIKSKTNVINSNVTYIHSIKSKKSIVNSVSSKASLKVGLKSNIADVPINPMSKSMLMKEIPEELLKGNMQKKVFVPVYLGKKKSSKTNKGEKNKNAENISKSENESNVIPLLLTKLKTMEEQISDIENTTKKINEAVSQKNMFNVKNPSKASKCNPVQPNNKGLATHKMYPKRSFKKFKQNKTDSKSKTNTPTCNTSKSCIVCKNNTDLSFNSIAGLKNAAGTMNNKDKMTNIKNILDNPENFLKHHSFVIPSNFSEKTLFKANPNVGCDVILKLFEALSEANDSHNETRTDDTQINKLFTNIHDIDSPQQNVSDIKTKLGGDEKPKGLSSLSESQMGLLGNKTDGQNKNCSQQKKNISCSSSSTVLSYKDNTEEQKLASKNSLTFSSEKDKDQLHKMPENEKNYINNEIKSIAVDKKYENTINKPPSGSKSYIFFPKKESEELERTHETMITKEGFEVEKNEEINNINSPNSLNKTISTFKEEMEKNEPQLAKIVSDNKIFESSVKTNNDELNLKLEENINLKDVKLQVSEGQIEKQVIKLPIATDSTNICSICIEPAVDLNPPKLSEVEFKGTKLGPDAKKEPKFSITILVKNNLDEEMLFNNDITMNNNNDSEKISFSEVKDEKQCVTVQKGILSVSAVDVSTRHQSSEKNVNFNSEKYIPPLRFETSNTTPTSLATCSLADKSNLKNEKGLSKLNSDHKTNEFGIEGVTYLNQEQRKKLEAQVMNSVCNKKSQEPKNTTLKPGAKSTINLKNNFIPVRHLSESSLNFQKPIMRNVYKQSTQPSGKTINKSIKNCRKNPYNPLECLKFRKEHDITNRLQEKYTNMKLPSSQGLGCADKAIRRNKEESYSLSNTRSSLSNISYFDAISKTLTVTNNKTGHKKDFCVVCNEKPVEDSRNAGVPNSSFIKKRSHRCHMTLKEPVSDDITFDLLYDKMGIGDHQTKNIDLISTKVINKSKSVERFEKNNAVFNPVNEKPPTINRDSDINVELADESNFMITSQPKRSANKDCALISSPVPESPKCPGVLAKATSADFSKQNKHSNNQSNGAVTSQPELLVKPDFGFALAVPESSLSCPCVLTVVEKPSHDKVNRDLINFSAHKVTSKSKISIPPECGLVSLTVSDMPKCCPCMLAKANTTTETITRSKAEVLLEKAGPHPGKIWKISIICNICMSKYKNMNTNLYTENTDPPRGKYNKHEDLYMSKPDQNLEDNKVFNVQSETIITKNEITAEGSDGKPIGSESQLITNENNSCLFLGNRLDESLDEKLQNEIKNVDVKKRSCHHTCLNIPSDDSMYCDVSDNNPQNTFCLDVIADSDIPYEHTKIGNGILDYYSNKNEAYSLENISNSTTVFRFNGKENIKFYKIIPDENPETCDGTKEGNDSTEYIENRENNNNTKCMENNKNSDNQSLININCSQEEPYKNVRNVSNSHTQWKDQLNYTQINLNAGDDWADHVNPVGTSKTIYSDSVPDRRYPYLSENNNNQSLISINCSQEDPYKNVRTVSNSGAHWKDQLNGTQTNLNAGDDWFVNSSHVMTSTNIYSGFVPDRRHQYLAEQKENNDNKSLISINYSQEDPYKSFRNANNSYTQCKDQQNNLKTGDWFDNDSPVGTPTTIYSGLVPDRRHQYLANTNQARVVKKGTYKSFKRSMLKTIKENDLEQNSYDISPNDFQDPLSQIMSFSTNYIVNCVHSIEYDFMSDNRNSVFACSVNSYSSVNSNI